MTLLSEHVFKNWETIFLKSKLGNTSASGQPKNILGKISLLDYEFYLLFIFICVTCLCNPKRKGGIDMANITVISLPKCLKCGKRYASMVQVGPMIFCGVCYSDEFSAYLSSVEIHPETQQYQKWLKRYKLIGE